MFPWMMVSLSKPIIINQRFFIRSNKLDSWVQLSIEWMGFKINGLVPVRKKNGNDFKVIWPSLKGLLN
jgi:hypothetical protein